MLAWLPLIATAGLGGAGWWWFLRRPLPRTAGRETVDGLTDPVEILRDDYGIPHLVASSTEDALFAQGYVHAQDRLWQMELNRRIGLGRLAEVFGPQAVPADRFVRRVGVHRLASLELERLRPEERSLLEAYARGVNACLERLPARPFELQLLRLDPEPWQPLHSLVWPVVMALDLGANWESELLRGRLAARLGPELAARLHLGYAPDLPVTVPPASQYGDSADELLELYRQAEPYLSLGSSGGSNAWVVSGRRSESGRPLLASDPHLLLRLPSVWYEAHLVTPELDVYGAGLPGFPGVVIGHNPHVAWGVTNSFADAQDLYVERFDPERPGFYQTPQGWEQATTVREVIRVKGRPDEIETVYVTRHGPLMSGGPVDGQEEGLSFCWAVRGEGHRVSAVVGVNRATSAAELKEALRDWDAPALNVVFGDVSGNIGFIMAGRVPKRGRPAGLFPLPGWDPDCDWQGWLSYEELPQAWNPECGYIVTANNAVVGREYPHYISWDFMGGYRAARIEQVLLSRERHRPTDFAALQRDVRCLSGLEFAAHCQGLRPADPLEQEALQALLSWDGNANADSVGAAVYEAMLLWAVRKAFEPAIGSSLLAELMGGASLNPLSVMAGHGGRYVGLLLGCLRTRDGTVLGVDDPERAAARWEEILAEALSEAVLQLRALLGPDVLDWRWGELHRVKLRHALGLPGPLSLLLNGPEVPIGGDTDTPLQTPIVPHQPFRAGAWCPSWRQVVDLAAPEQAVSVLPSGQSGHPASRHYLDQFRLWYQGDYHPQYLTRTRLEQHLEDRLLLEPRRQAPAAGAANQER